MTLLPLSSATYYITTSTPYTFRSLFIIQVTMVSFHKALSETPITEVPAEFESPPRKRKCQEETLTEEFFKIHPTDAEKRKSIFGIELHLETPLPSHKLRQYLTIQVYYIHKYWYYICVCVCVKLYTKLSTGVFLLKINFYWWICTQTSWSSF